MTATVATVAYLGLEACPLRGQVQLSAGLPRFMRRGADEPPAFRRRLQRRQKHARRPMVASVAGELQGGRMTRRRPFRSPHHSASMPALVGGGLRVCPGEISLAHLGVLFLNELPEFQRAVLDSLRQPLETGKVSVARANTHVTFPARVQLVAAMNPCRCGHLGDPALACSRAPKCAADYYARVSGPLLDRLDLHVEVQAYRRRISHFLRRLREKSSGAFSRS